MRLFVAVNLPTEVRAKIQSAIDAFPIDDPPWRWVGPDNWHLTLKFLGETEAARVSALTHALSDVASHHHAFDMNLGSFGGFPNLRNPRVLFFKVDQGALELERLAADVDRAVEKAIGLDREKRRFQAHVTVARVKETLPPDVSARFARVPQLSTAVHFVDSIQMMESRLQRTGAVYSVVKEFALF